MKEIEVEPGKCEFGDKDGILKTHGVTHCIVLLVCDTNKKEGLMCHVIDYNDMKERIAKKLCWFLEKRDSSKLTFRILINPIKLTPNDEKIQLKNIRTVKNALAFFEISIDAKNIKKEENMRPPPFGIRWVLEKDEIKPYRDVPEWEMKLIKKLPKINYL